MRLDEEVLRALEQGLLSPPEVTDAISILLSEYPLHALEGIFANVRNRDPASSGPAKDFDAVRESSAPWRDGLLARVADLGIGLLRLGDEPRLADLRLSLVDMRRQDRYIALLDGSGVSIPDFQFVETQRGLQPRLTARTCNTALVAGHDPWGALSWWTSANGWLGGKAPVSLLDSDQEKDLPLLARAVTELVG